MNNIGPQQILDQIKSYHAELQATPSSQAVDKTESGFGALIADAIEQVNKSQLHAADMKRDFESGASNASLADVMIASQKANLSFRAMTEVRNKLVTAYQEIMNMPV